MYLPRSLISMLYLHLQKTHHPLSPPVLILVALEPDALCGCRILTQLLKRDYIAHKIQPIAGYGDLEKAGQNVIQPMMEVNGGSGGVVVCLGVGGMVDLGGLLGIDGEEEQSSYGGVEVWVIDARRPWNLGNVFGGHPPSAQIEQEGELVSQPHTGLEGGKILRNYKPGKGGIIVFDDGDVEEDLVAERDAYLALVEMPEMEDNGDDLQGSDTEDEGEDEEEDNTALSKPGQKRKSWTDRGEDEESSDEDDRPRQRRRSNSSSPIPDSPIRPKQRGLLSLDESAALNTSVESRSVSPSPAQPPKGPSARKLRRRLLKIRRQHESVLQKYYSLGSSYSEPISTMMYSLASELGREDNDLLWMTIVGVASMELYGRSSVGVAITTQKMSTSSRGWLGTRGSRTRQLLRDEVRRLNPPELTDSSFSSNRNSLPENNVVIPTTARSPTDTSIRLSPEPKLLLIRHWSLYDSMLHSPYLSARLHIWSDSGKKRLHKLLAKMGVSLVQCKQSYPHMDMELKRSLRNKLLKYSKMYGLDDLVPSAETDGKDRGGTKEGWGFVRSWGWRATLSAQDVGVVVGAMLEVGKKTVATLENGSNDRGRDVKETFDEDGTFEGEEWVGRFWDAYDALEKIEELKAALPTAQLLHRAILRTGTGLIEKRQIRHLRAFRMCVVKEGPDVTLFTHPAALTKLALWIGEAIAEQEKESKGKLSHGGRGTPLVVAGLNESRGVYIVVGTGGGGGGGMGFGDKTAAKERKEKREAKIKARELKRKNKEQVREEKREARRLALGDDEDEDEESESEDSDDSSDSDSDEEEETKSQVRGFGRNKFGNAFQEVVEETSARVRIDSFEHCVVEVKKEDLAGFLESLSMKAVVG
ncbi:CDC45-like protein [Diplocarpon rosae]|nr:CDC45-like protein [Diplocarpon rosae]